MRPLLAAAALLAGVWGLLGAADIRAERVAVAGAVTDARTGAPLSSALVTLPELGLSSRTDLRGMFRIENVPPGSWLAIVEKERYIARTVRLTASAGRPPSPSPASAAVALEPLSAEVTVTAAPFPGGEAAVSSRREMSGDEVRAMPGTFEDVSRALQSSPGVASSGDFKNDLIVRGGSPAENLYLVDDFQVPALSHFGSQGSSGGAVGLLNTGLIRDVEFTSGGFPAAYGDKLSSVTRVRLREGDRRRLRARLGLSLFGVSGLAEGPFASGRGSWTAAYRRDFFKDIPTGLTLDMTVVPDFADAQVKAVLDITPALRLSFLGLSGRDRLRVEETEDPPEERMKIEIGDSLNVAGVSLRAQLGPETIARLSLSRSAGVYSYANIRRGVERYSIRSEEGEAAALFEVEGYLRPGLKLMAGVAAKAVEARHRVYYRGGYLVIDRMGFRYTRTDRDARLDFEKLGFHLQAVVPLAGRLAATAGVRLDYNGATGRSAAGPRAGLSWPLSPAVRLHASWGRYFQSPETFWLASHPDNRSLPFLEAEHVVAGAEWTPGRSGGLGLRLEAYAKTYGAYPVDPANPSLTLANMGGSIIPSFFGSKLVGAGSGYARGLEASLEQKPRDGAALSWLVNYSYSVVKFRALDGVLRSGDFDFRHILNAAAALRLPAGWTLSLKWRFAGGQPYTPFDLLTSTARDGSYFDMSAVNSLRFPPYHRLDFRAEKTFVFKGWSLEAALDVQNIYNRRNVYYRYFDDGAEKTVYYLPLVPLLGFRVDF